NPLLRFNAVGSAAPTPAANMSFVIPWAEGTTSIVLLHGTTVLDTREVSAGAPSVLITSPAAPVSWPAGSTQTLAWSGADPDGDEHAATGPAHHHADRPRQRRPDRQRCGDGVHRRTRDSAARAALGCSRRHPLSRALGEGRE